MHNRYKKDLMVNRDDRFKISLLKMYKGWTSLMPGRNRTTLQDFIDMPKNKKVKKSV